MGGVICDVMGLLLMMGLLLLYDEGGCGCNFGSVFLVGMLFCAQHRNRRPLA
jgi:hypothetical protein